MKVPGVEYPADKGTKHLAQKETHYHRRAVEDGVSGRTGDLSQAALGYGDGNRSRTL